mgnify:FL=1
MAGVKPVEYKKDSSTTGFAIAGDQKQITKDNAVTIEKDVKQGNTNDLDNAQSKYLESQIEDVDNIEYSDDERKNVGKNQINTDDTENSSAGNAVGSMGGMAALAGLQGYLGTLLAATNGWTAPIIGAAYIAEGVLTQQLVKAFDDQYESRMKQLNAKDDTNQTIQSYYDQMAADMDTMTEDAATYADLSEQKVTADVDRITQIGALQAQIAVYQAQGDDEKVAEIQAQIAELTKEGEADGTGGKIDELQQGLETYSGNNAEAVGVADSGATVAEFLGDGQQMGVLAKVSAAILTVGALTGAIIAAKGIAKSGIFSKIPAMIGAAICLGGMALYISAASQMNKKGSNEMDCADAGSEMQEYVNNLLGNVSSQAGFTESTGAEYTEIAAKNAETTQKTQEGVDKANKNNPVVAPKPTGNGEGNNPDEEKPPVVGAGEGAAA